MITAPASSVWMVRPAAFYANDETALTNYFQHGKGDHTLQAQQEFDEAVNLLRRKGIEVIVSQSADTQAPDAIFPNNWISFHNGLSILYPMQAVSRRRERDIPLPEVIATSFPRILDLLQHENQGKFLEGTGSIVFDHAQKIAFASLSSRTDKGLFEMVCDELGYHPFSFSAIDANGKSIYHTNVVMFVGREVGVVCADAISDVAERYQLLELLQQNGRDVVIITLEQMHSFSGNMLQVSNSKGETFIVLSSTAESALTDQQLEILKRKSELLVVDIPTIEKIGGGSVRCMMAELYFPE